MLVLQIALGVFLGALAFHYRRQLAPIAAVLLSLLLSLVLLVGVGYAYYLLTTPAGRDRHLQLIITLGVILAGMFVWALVAPTQAGQRLAARWTQWEVQWKRWPVWSRVGSIAAAMALIVGLIVLL